MAPVRVLQLNFTFDLPASELEQELAPLVGEFAAVPGLLWKIWVIDEVRGQAGGICLFADQTRLQAFLGGRLMEELRESPSVQELTAKEFDVVADLTALTRGPVRPTGRPRVQRDGPRPVPWGRGAPRFRDRRSGEDRRRGLERRSGLDRRSGYDRRGGDGEKPPAERRAGGDRRRGERRALAQRTDPGNPDV